MRSIFAIIAAKYLKPVLMVFSVLVLFRGHNNPGGGFIAALLLSSGIVFESVIDANEKRNRSLLKGSWFLITSGMIMILAAAVAGFFTGKPLLSGLWVEIRLPLFNLIELGTPILFDAGIYLLVSGGLILIFQSVIEEIEWK